MEKRTEEYIEINTSCENQEFPTRARIIAFDGTFEHAGDYSAPQYTFSVQVEIMYNKVVDGKEENLVTCKFWTKEDSAIFSFEDDDLDEDSVDDWFWEGLFEDLSNHGLESLEDLDFYASNVPTNKADELGRDLESAIANALDQSIPGLWTECEFEYSPIYEADNSTEVSFSKTKEISRGEAKAIWSLEDFDLSEGEYEDGDPTILASFYVKGELFIGEELFFAVGFWSAPSYLMDPCNDVNANAVKVIEEKDMEWLLDCESNDFRLYDICSDYEEFVGLMEDFDSLEEGVEESIRNSFKLDEYADDIDVTLGPLAHKWIEENN